MTFRASIENGNVRNVETFQEIVHTRILQYLKVNQTSELSFLCMYSWYVCIFCVRKKFFIIASIIVSAG